jgi:hypothetical protein
MPTTRSLIAALTLALTAISCSDKGPTSPATDNAPSLAPAATAGPIQYVFNAVAVTDPVLGAGTFSGVLKVTSFGRNAQNQLVANGTLTGTATFAGGVTKSVTDAVFTGAVVAQQQRRCTILHLDIGPIFLDLLGLQITTNRIILDITAVAGPGNLLGNLLCALVGLLDNTPLNLAAIDRLLAQINAILGA